MLTSTTELSCSWSWPTCARPWADPRSSLFRRPTPACRPAAQLYDLASSSPPPMVSTPCVSDWWTHRTSLRLWSWLVPKSLSLQEPYASSGSGRMWRESASSWATIGCGGGRCLRPLRRGTAARLRCRLVAHRLYLHEKTDLNWIRYDEVVTKSDLTT